MTAALAVEARLFSSELPDPVNAGSPATALLTSSTLAYAMRLPASLAQRAGAASALLRGGKL